MRLPFLVRAGAATAATAIIAPAFHLLPRRELPQEPHSQKPSAPSPAAAATADDPHQWLEEIEGSAALGWCKAQNARTVAAVGDPLESASYRTILAIADSKDKIPYVGRIGGVTGDEQARI